MVTQFSLPIWSQRDLRWASQRLGTVDGTTIGGQGCLITSIAMMNAGFDPENQLTPNQVDDLFTNNNGYANGNLVIWNAINRLLPNCALTGAINCATSPAPVADIANHLEQGYLAILQVGFNGNPANMHYLVGYGYNGSDVMYHDPWFGDTSSFATSRRYGTGDSAKDILAIHYFGDAISNEPIKPIVPVAKLPATAPLLGNQRIAAEGGAFMRSQPLVDASLLTVFNAGATLDFKGYVHGEFTKDSDIWFVGAKSTEIGHFIHSHDLIDFDTHDLPDLTVYPPTPTPIVEPVPTPEVTPEPAPVPTPVVVPVTEVPVFAQTYYDKPEKNREVTPQGGTDVINVATGAIVHHLNQGEKVLHIAGYFQASGIDYARTAYAKEQGLWNGVRSQELGPPEVEVPVQVLDVKAFLEQENEAVDQLLAEAEQASSSSSVGRLFRELLATLISPILKRIGKKG